MEAKQISLFKNLFVFVSNELVLCTILYVVGTRFDAEHVTLKSEDNGGRMKCGE